MDSGIPALIEDGFSAQAAAPNGLFVGKGSPKLVARVSTVAFSGIDVIEAGAEVQMASGLPDKAVAEARERVCGALASIELSLPPKHISINLALADVLKEGSHFDLPIALALLIAMDVVPADAALIVTARIPPKDIDSVHVGQEARVTISAFNSRKVAPLDATVVTVSADRLLDANTGEAYFQADLRIALEALKELPAGQELSPGMPAQAMIVTGERSILSYLVNPLTDTIGEAMREE